MERRSLWTIREVAQHLGVSTKTVSRLTAHDPTFPRPARLSSQTLRWRPEEIDAWVTVKQRPQ